MSSRRTSKSGCPAIFSLSRLFLLFVVLSYGILVLPSSWISSVGKETKNKVGRLLSLRVAGGEEEEAVECSILHKKK